MKIYLIEGINFLGKEVEVIIDRPIYSLHPDYGFIYELNYGFIPNTKAGDGEEIDVYVIGANKPLERFKGLVKGIIIRFNDNENKLVVSRPAYNVTKEEVRRKTLFQEQYFDVEIKVSH